MFENDVVRNGEIAWSVQKNHKPGTMQVVSEVMCKNTPLLPRQAFERKVNCSIYSRLENTPPKREIMFL